MSRKLYLEFGNSMLAHLRDIKIWRLGFHAEFRAGVYLAEWFGPTSHLENYLFGARFIYYSFFMFL